MAYNYDVKVGDQTVSIETEEPFTPEEQQEAAKIKLAATRDPGFLEKGGTLDQYTKWMGPLSFGSSIAARERNDRGSLGENLKAFGKDTAYNLPAVAAQAAIPGAGPASIALRGAGTAIGNGALALLFGEDPTLPMAVGGTASMVGDTAMGLANRLLGGRQQATDVKNVSRALSEVTGYDIPDTPAGISEVYTPKGLPGAVQTRAGQDYGTTMKGLVDISGNPHVNLKSAADPTGKEIRLSKALEIVEDLGLSINRLAGTEAQKEAIALQDDIKRQLEASLRARGYDSIANAYRQANALHRVRMGTARMMNDEGVLSPEGNLDMQRLQGSYHRQMQGSPDTGAGITNDPNVERILRAAIRRGAPGYSSTDLPGQFHPPWIRMNPNSVGASENLGYAFKNRLPTKIGDAVTLDPMVGGMLSIGAPVGAIQILRSHLGNLPSEIAQ